VIELALRWRKCRRCLVSMFVVAIAGTARPTAILSDLDPHQLARLRLPEHRHQRHRAAARKAEQLLLRRP
jgi:hypothetical protein